MIRQLKCGAIDVMVTLEIEYALVLEELELEESNTYIVFMDGQSNDIWSNGCRDCT